MDHGFQHLGSHHHQLAGVAAGAHDLFLQPGHFFGRQFHAEVAARHHHRVRLLDDLVQVLDRRGLFQLDHDRGTPGDQLARLGDVVRLLDERQRYPLDAEVKAEPQVLAVFFRQRGKVEDDARHVDPLVVR